MNSNKDFKSSRQDQSTDSMRKDTRLSPMRKSGKDKYAMYEKLDDEDEESYTAEKKHESVMDYYDD